MCDAAAAACVRGQLLVGGWASNQQAARQKSFIALCAPIKPEDSFRACTSHDDHCGAQFKLSASFTQHTQCFVISERSLSLPPSYSPTIYIYEYIA